MNLNDDNIELYLFRYKEGLLDDADVSEVEQALATHPEWQAMSDLYDPNLTLPAGVTMEYANAESLRDGGPKAQRKPVVIVSNRKKQNFRPIWLAMAGAACLLLLVTTAVRLSQVPQGGSSQPLAVNTVVADTIKTLQDTVIEMDMKLHSPRANKNYAVVKNHGENTMLAAVEEYAMPAVTETETNHADSLWDKSPNDGNGSIQADNLGIEEINNPMEQESFYAEGIIVRNEDSNGKEQSSSRGEQFRNWALRATNLAANIASNHHQRLDAFEESIENNELLSNLIATIE